MTQRPLLRHIRDHKALFLEIARLRDRAVGELGLTNYEFHKTPKFISSTGERLTIEPERSIILPTTDLLRGVKSKLVRSRVMIKIYLIISEVLEKMMSF